MPEPALSAFLSGRLDTPRAFYAASKAGNMGEMTGNAAGGFMNITFLLNGETVELCEVDPTRSLLSWLREERGLTGTKEGCNEGDCGACSVLVSNGEGVAAQNACLLLLGQLDGRAITTVEGLSGPKGVLHPVQQALVDHHGSQCGFCTPGIAVTLAGAHLQGATDFDTRLAGNLCRCTGYAPIVRAAQSAAEMAVPEWFAPQKRPQGDGAQPTSVDALANEIMRRPHATLIAGNTDVGLWLNKDLRKLSDVIFLGDVADLKRHVVDAEGIHIGAGVSIEALRELLDAHHPHFAAMLARFASAQIRAAATIGGNIANASPIGDTPPALIALDARLYLRRGEARRVVALEDFFIAYGRQDRQAGEFIEGLTIPRQEDNLRVYKNSKRFDQDISAVLGAFNIAIKDGIVQSARIAFGGMAATPKRARAVEAALLGQPWSRQSIATAQGVFERDFTPIDDLRASAAYRLDVARAMLERAWLEDQGVSTNVREVAP